MGEYLKIGHTSVCEVDQEGGYFLPHHPVIKETNETTKVLPVFDAFLKTSTGISLNDTLVEPTIQNTIFKQALRFRIQKFIITADIEKMYRQVLVHPDYRKFQQVLWLVYS